MTTARTKAATTSASFGTRILTRCIPGLVSGGCGESKRNARECGLKTSGLRSTSDLETGKFYQRLGKTCGPINLTYIGPESAFCISVRPPYNARRQHGSCVLQSVPADVTTDLCKRYIAWRQKAGVADSTINRTLAALKRMFHLATECTPPKVQFVPYIPMLQENNVRTGFVEAEARMRLEQACGRVGQWMLAMFEVGCTYGWRHGSLLKMRVKQVDPHANVIRLEPGTTKNKTGLEVTMPRRVRELVLECIKGKGPEDCLFTRANGTPVRDFRRSWTKACAEAGTPALHFHDLRRTAARNMRRGHISERVAMAVGGWKTTSVFHRYAIVDNEDIANAMDMLERSQDQQRQHLEEALAAKGSQMGAIMDGSPTESNRKEPQSISSGNSAVTSRLHHVGPVVGVTGHLHRGRKKAHKTNR